MTLKIKYTIANIQQTKSHVKLKTYNSSITHKSSITYKTTKGGLPLLFLFYLLTQIAVTAIISKYKDTIHQTLYQVKNYINKRKTVY